MSEAAPEPQPRRLSLRRVIWGAFALSWQHRVSLFRATAMPMLAVIAFILASNVTVFEGSQAPQWFFYFLYGLATAWLAIAIHRLVLLETADSGQFDAHSLKRIAIFFGVLVGMCLLYAGLVLLIASGVLAVFTMRYIPTGGLRAELPVPFEWVNTGAIILAYWAVARVSLLLPAIAIDRKPDFAAAWQASARNGWRLAVIVGALPWCLKQLTEFIYRDGASALEFGLIVVVTTAFTVIEVVALSLSYWELTAPAPPTTDPPA